MSDILNKATVLVLNRNWQAIHVKTPAEAFCMIASGAATALDVQGNDAIATGSISWADGILAAAVIPSSSQPFSVPEDLPEEFSAPHRSENHGRRPSSAALAKFVCIGDFERYESMDVQAQLRGEAVGQSRLRNQIGGIDLTEEQLQWRT